MIRYMTPSTLRPEHFRVNPTDRPGWVRGTTRLPLEGEAIFCAAGLGTVKTLHGKTGDGSRLLQIAFADKAMRPFFAAASNVLLPPPGALPADDALPLAVPSSSPAEPHSPAAGGEWLGARVPGQVIGRAAPGPGAGEPRA